MKKPNKTLDVFSENQKQMIAKTLLIFEKSIF